MKKIFFNNLQLYDDAGRPIIYIKHFDVTIVEQFLNTQIENKADVFEYDEALGDIDFRTKSFLDNDTKISLEQFLVVHYQDAIFNSDNGKTTYILLHDVDSQLHNEGVIAILKRIAIKSFYQELSVKVIIVNNRIYIPPALENYITVLEYPLPDDNEIKEIINKTLDELGIKKTVSPELLNQLQEKCKGLNELQIITILRSAYANDGKIDSNDFSLINDEKRRFIKNASNIECIESLETSQVLGGLNNLKNYIQQKAKVFHNLRDARKNGVDVPKGILLLGVPGCGKSLASKVIANTLELPLLRLDIGRLMGKYVGESEENLRNALSIAESSSPCVMWIDEVEKAFSGINNNASNDVTIRLFGNFLTWLQEHKAPVYVVATSNKIDGLPPEFLRKGRFDELFYIGLPEIEEREEVLRIHIRKRTGEKTFNKIEKNLDFHKLAEQTTGYSGADLESIVKNAIEYCYLNKKDLQEKNLFYEIRNMKVSNEKHDNMEEVLRNYNIKNARGKIQHKEYDEQNTNPFGRKYEDDMFNKKNNQFPWF